VCRASWAVDLGISCRSLNVIYLRERSERRINLLDLTIHRKHNKFSIDIYRKPTFTDTIIPNDSCHPEEHKLAAVRFLYNRVDNYHLPLTEDKMKIS